MNTSTGLPPDSTNPRTGRPSDYSPELAAEICGLLAEGNSLRTICERDDMPDKSTVMRWLAKEEYQAFRDQYARARDTWADAMAEEILDISDDGARDTYTDKDGNERTDHEVVARSRLRVDTRKWLMARMAPKKYGDKVTTEVHGKDGGPIAVEDVSEKDLARRLAFLLTRGARSTGNDDAAG